eukprot:TRINITY_DN14957_c1_g2_i1.p1 TRINITY_DN14957_c1_g2~~TRINITY_DN14957_c1_g2_i1.p1  ORF type:complete len:227 (-),score=36.89 TRINITY_DN14957_c1_g2_i1:37-717(-)
MQITITNVAGACFPIDTVPNATVAEAKACLQQQHGFAASSVTFYLGDAKLADESHLQDLGIDDQVALTMILNDLEPIVLHVPSHNDSRQGDDWRELIRSEKLKSSVAQIFVDATTFTDQEWGNCKGNIGIALFDENDTKVQFCNVFGTFRSDGYEYGKSPSRMLDAVEKVVSEARPGYHYRVLYTVGGGGCHTIKVEGLRCVIYPEGCNMDVVPEVSEPKKFCIFQ